MEFLDYIVLDNSVRDILVVFGTIGMALLFRKILSKYSASLLYLPVKKYIKYVDKHEFIALTLKPLGWFLTILIALFSLYKLQFPEAWQFDLYGLAFKNFLHKFGICLSIVYFIWLVQSFIIFFSLILEQKARSTSGRKDDQLIYFLRDFLKVLVYIVGFLLILKAGFNRDIGAILTGLSIVGAALALAAKESIENLIASFIIFFDKPFFAGDTVNVRNITGTVEHIGLRSTRIRTIDKTLVTVPNKQMVDGVVDNWSMRTNRRLEVKLEFQSQTSTEQLKKVLAGITDFMEANKPPIVSHHVFISDFNKNGVAITSEYLTIPFSMDEFNILKEKFNLHNKMLIEQLELRLIPAANQINIIQPDALDEPQANRPII